MSTPSSYKLSIEIILPKTLVEGNIFKVTYRVRNISGVLFPGGVVAVLVSWPNIGPSLLVNHPIPIKSLQPDEQLEFSKDEKAATSGMTIFTHPGATFKANDGVPIELYLVDGRKLVPGQLIGGTRARSHEEVSQAQAVWIAALALVALVIFQIIDWLLRYYLHF